LPERIGEIAQRAGVGLLFMLMALAVFNDLVRLF
jgi:regulator of sigma E protease